MSWSRTIKTNRPKLLRRCETESRAVNNDFIAVQGSSAVYCIMGSKTRVPAHYQRQGNDVLFKVDLFV